HQRARLYWPQFSRKRKNRMLDTSRVVQKVFSLALTGVLLWLPIAASAQDLVPISSLTGGSSVFVFRNAARAARRVIPIAKPARTKSQQMETVAKLNKQYTATSKLHRESAKVLEPAKLPKVGTLPPAQGSKLLAGVGEYYLAHNDLDKATEFF